MMMFSIHVQRQEMVRQKGQLWFLNMKHTIKFNIYKLTGPLMQQLTPISIKATRRIIIMDLE